jgi:hypothetical protein
VPALKYYVNLNGGGGGLASWARLARETATRVLVRKYFLLLMVAREGIEEDSEQQKSA